MASDRKTKPRGQSKAKSKGKNAKGPTPRKTLPPLARPARPSLGRRRQRRDDELFFTRLRTHAKWVFVLLAVSFALGFVLFGVGSGQGGLGNLFSGSGLFNSSGPSLSSLEKKANSHPKSVSAWRNLAAAYQGRGQKQKAISALTHAVTLSPRDAASLTQLASLYQQQSQDAQQQLQSLSSQSQGQVLSQPFLGQSKLGQALGQDPLASSLQQSQQQRQLPLEQTYQSAGRNAIDTLKLLILASPKDPTVHLQLASAAAQLGQYQTALAAARKYLKLVPDSPQLAQVQNFISKVKQALKAQTASTHVVTPPGQSQPVKVAAKPKK